MSKIKKEDLIVFGAQSHVDSYTVDPEKDKNEQLINGIISSLDLDGLKVSRVLDEYKKNFRDTFSTQAELIFFLIFKFDVCNQLMEQIVNLLNGVYDEKKSLAIMSQEFMGVHDKCSTVISRTLRKKCLTCFYLKKQKFSLT